MKCTLVQSEATVDWYTIERVEHDGRKWLESTGPGSMALRYSGRISDADVEGTAEEMLAIAVAIEQHENVSFKRCAIGWASDGTAELMSPRNSMRPARITADDAKHLAAEIRRVLGVPS